MWPVLGIKEIKRRKACKTLPESALKRYLSHPFPAKNLECRDAGIVALDFETTGLDPERDQILSIGLVEIDNLSIRLDTAWQQLVQTSRPIPGSSAVIHGITDDLATKGVALRSILPELLGRLAGKVLLVHHRTTEQSFLDSACRKLYGSAFIAPMIDTEALARHRFEKRHIAFKPADLRLFNLRRRYGLPSYRAHNALSDSVATAELFLAIVADIQPAMNVRLKEVLYL
jgi:DNA polymerase-3 subunit epsilon